MNKEFEDLLITNKYPESHILRYSEYRKGSNEYGQLFQDLMMILRLKREKDSNEVILDLEDIKNINFKKLIKLSKNIKEMRKLGMSFDIEIIGNKIRFYNLNNVNKESRPWENIEIK